jgi:hypothetical protein
MGFKSALNLGLKIGTKLVRSLAEKSFYLCELLGGGGGGLKLTLNLMLNLAPNLSH